MNKFKIILYFCGMLNIISASVTEETVEPVKPMTVIQFGSDLDEEALDAEEIIKLLKRNKNTAEVVGFDYFVRPTGFGKKQAIEVGEILKDCPKLQKVSCWESFLTDLEMANLFDELKGHQTLEVVNLSYINHGLNTAKEPLKELIKSCPELCAVMTRGSFSTEISWPLYLCACEDRKGYVIPQMGGWSTTNPGFPSSWPSGQSHPHSWVSNIKSELLLMAKKTDVRDFANLGGTAFLNEYGHYLDGFKSGV